MKIHYNNGTDEKIIENVLYIQVIDGLHLVSCVMRNGKEYTISLSHIEAIMDDELSGGGKAMREGGATR